MCSLLHLCGLLLQVRCEPADLLQQVVICNGYNNRLRKRNHPPKKYEYMCTVEGLLLTIICCGLDTTDIRIALGRHRSHNASGFVELPAQ